MILSLRPSTVRAILSAVFLSVLLAGCGSQDVVGSPYTGALRSAKDIVDCRTPGASGSTGEEVYSEGATASSPEGALETARGEGGFGGVQDGLQKVASEKDRVLYVVKVDEVIKQAVIVRDGPATKGAGGPGWYVESWAHCDESELPRSHADEIGLQIWEGPDGPAPTSEINSWTGPRHCDWQSMTFLSLGEDANYVRAPQAELGAYFAEKYREHVAVPDDAHDTGYSREGKKLWVSADKERVYVGTAQDAELWPRTIEPLGCD